jgi:membrane protease YdiL (CAAX protease family)
MRAGDKAWGFWTTALWVMAALVLKDYLFPKFEHLVLNGTAVGHAIDAHLALGAVNLALVWLVPILLLLAAVWMKRLPVRSYFAWVATRPGIVLLALAAGAAFQLLTYALAYLAGADMTSDAVAQYRSAQTAGDPVWLPLFLAWSGFIAAPLVEESIFRGFLWRGWDASRLGARGTWLLSSLVFAAYHIEKAIGMGPVNGGIMLFEVFLLGLLMGWLRWRSGSTLPGMAAHFANNVIPPVATFMIGAISVGH